MENKKLPSIKTIPNGPYRFMNIPFMTESRNKHRIELPSQKGSICRCGASKKMPFCDGGHVAAGFSTEGQKVVKSSEKSYVGKGVIVHFDATVCAHVGICVRGLPEVFDVKKRPWIEPDKADVASLVELIRKCPSGALSYTIDGVRVDSFDSEVAVEVVRNGPLNVYGGIELVDEKQPKEKDHYSLCRCGKSKNTPFCDGSHLKARFEHATALKKIEE